MPNAEGMSEPPPRSESGACEDSPGYGEQTTENDNDAAGELSPTPVGSGSIFGDDTELVPHVSGVTSALNLLGKVESWGINTGTQVQDMALKVSSLTGAQLNQLLRALPDGIAYELSLNKEEK